MIKLLKIEFKKIRTYKTFWILFGLYFLFLSLGLLMAEYMLNGIINDINRHTPIPLPHVKIYFFPSVWQNISFFASLRYVLIFPATVIIILITNEFHFKTIRQNVITGMSKTEFITSKLILIVLISIIITVFLLVGTFILGLSNTADPSLGMILERSSFIFGFFISILTFQILALFFGFILRNTGLSIAIFTMYVFIAEPILYYFLKSPLVFKNEIYTYLPVNSILRVTEYPSIPVLKTIMGLNLQDSVTLSASLIPLLYSTVMLGIVHVVLKKRDL